jgi:imidazolonepropionase-like amidohydrolase
MVPPPDCEVYSGRVSATVLMCGSVFDGLGDELRGPSEILVEDGRITEVADHVSRPDGADMVDLSDRVVTPGFIDCHVHLTMDASTLPTQTLKSSAAKALSGLDTARRYMLRGFTTLRDLGTMDPDFPTVDLRNAIDAGLVEGPRLVVAAHLISSTGGHADIRPFYAPRWDLPIAAAADSVGEIRRLVRREHAFGSDWIKATNAGGYFSPGDDPDRCTWFDEEFEALASAAALLGLPVAVHTGAAPACIQALKAGARSLEHAYLIDEEGIALAVERGAFIVPTMQMTQEDLAALKAGDLPEQAVWKFRRDSDRILASQRLIAESEAKVAFGTDCGMFPFEHGVLEFQALVDAGLTPARALRAATSVAAELLGRDDLGVIEAGRAADIVAMPGDPLADIQVTESVDFVMKAGTVYRRPE